MMYISFITALIGLAGIAGGIETGSTESIMVSAALYMGGVIGMAEAVKEEGDSTDGYKEDNGAGSGGSSPVDKHPGQCGRGQTEDR